MADGTACQPWQHRWLPKTNRYDQTYYECRRCGEIKGQ